MKRIAMIASACALTAAPVFAQNQDLLGGIVGQVQTNAKATAFDSAVESQAPGATVLTDQLSTEQKAGLFDLGVENAGTIGQVGAATGGTGGGLGTGAAVVGTASALGGVGAAQQAQPTYQQQPVYGQQPAYVQQPAYRQQPVYCQQTGYAQPVVTDAYGNATTAPAQPVYEQTGTVQPHQTAVDAYGNTVVTQAAQAVQPNYVTQTGAVQPAPVYVPPQTTAYGTTQQQIPAPSYNPPSQVGSGAATQSQSGLSYDPNSGQVTVGADAIQSIGTLITN